MKRVQKLTVAVIAGSMFACAVAADAQAPASAARPATKMPAAMSAAKMPEQSANAIPKERVIGAWKSLEYLHVAGGGCMWGIDVLVVVGVAFILERGVRMRRRRVLPMGLLKQVDAAMAKGEFKEAVEVCGRQKNNTLSRAVFCLNENAKASVQEREVAVNEVASREMDLHRMICLPLAAIAALAPLIGLLGTVVGIRECFRDVALAGEMGNPAMLAGGIEKALITTIYGLVVAIPTVFAYNFFRFRINLLANELEDALTMILRRFAAIREKRNEA
jgi:biopolymer transport protein ExbB